MKRMNQNETMSAEAELPNWRKAERKRLLGLSRLAAIATDFSRRDPLASPRITPC